MGAFDDFWSGTQVWSRETCLLLRANRMIRMGEAKGQECKFAKRTHLSDVKSVLYVFQGQRKQDNSEGIRSKRRGRTRPGHPQYRKPGHRDETLLGPTKVTWNKHLGGRARGKHRPSWKSGSPHPKRAGNQPLRSRVGSVSSYDCVGGPALRG
jgi:hypothetical protein